jgi:hypothetical protein
VSGAHKLTFLLICFILIKMNRLAGLPLTSFEDPIREALDLYSERTEGKVLFDSGNAARLALTPDKPNSARSATTVRHLGKTLGTLYVIAFDFEDGTGDESTYKLASQLDFGFYPSDVKVLPRSKASLHSEAHLTLASFLPKQPDADPIMFGGSLELVGFRKPRSLARLATLGQSAGEFSHAIFRETQPQPTVTYTTGNHPDTGERFGDPHAVFNSAYIVQVCGFVAISHEMARDHAAALPTLGAVIPKFRN